MRMKNIIRVCLLLFAVMMLFSQSINETPRYWVFFNDKGPDIDKKIQEYRNSLSEHNIQRRLRVRSIEDLVSYEDIPVYSEYIDGIEELGLKIKHSSKWHNAVSVYIRNENELELLRSLNYVKDITLVNYTIPNKSIEETDFEAGPVRRELEETDIPYGPSADALYMHDVPFIHNLGYDASGVIICMLDSGFNPSHDAFFALTVLGQYDFVNDDSIVSLTEDDDCTRLESHGTKSWSACGGYFPDMICGPSYQASFLLARTEYSCSESIVEEDNWAAGIEWAEENDADIVSSSLGYDDWYISTPEIFNGDSAITTKAADFAANRGILVVNSAGNNGSGTSNIVAPADADSIISVGAATSDTSLASFSSHGPTYDGRIKPELCALGTGVNAANCYDIHGYTNFNGTSAAAPLISGVCGLFLQIWPESSPMDVKEKLMQCGHNRNTPNNDFGWGVPNLNAAVRTCGDSLVMLPLEYGWSLISNPFTTPIAINDSIFPYLYADAFEYNPSTRNYDSISELAPGHACFVLMRDDTTIFLKGEFADSLAIELLPGWNMVGSHGYYSQKNDIIISPEIAVSEPFYSYDTQTRRYYIDNSLIPGTGRWILVSEPATLTSEKYDL